MMWEFFSWRVDSFVAVVPKYTWDVNDAQLVMITAEEHNRMVIGKVEVWHWNRIVWRCRHTRSRLVRMVAS